MNQLPFFLVDAFTQTAFEGNPCAVVLQADRLRAEQMQKIAREMNQSETAFLMNSKNCDLKARYFTPAGEIPLAGHPTIASIHTAIECGLIKNQNSRFTVKLELNEGPIDVQVERKESQNWIRMFQRKPIFGEIHKPERVYPLFGLNLEDGIAEHPPQTVSTGTPQLMVYVKNLEALRKMKINDEAFVAYRKSHPFFSSHLFTLESLSKEALTFARHPGSLPGLSEDPFTGSSTGGMAAYLWSRGLIREKKFFAEQGHWMNRPGRAEVEIITTGESIDRIVVGGSAVTVVRGELSFLN